MKKPDRESLPTLVFLRLRDSRGHFLLFFIPALLFCLGMVYLVPVEPAARVTPAGVGRVYSVSGHEHDLAVAGRTPFLFLYRRATEIDCVQDPLKTVDTAPDPTVALPPPAEPFREVLQSAVWTEEELLALPPQEADGKEAQP